MRAAPWQVVAAGAAVGLLGGMVGLGGAEFRLPLLIGLFGFVALQAVILNKAMSLLVVLTALPARLAAVPVSILAPQWPVVVNLLAGMLVLIAAALFASHAGIVQPLDLPTAARVPAGVVAGLFIGVVAAVMGVAGGELLIPTIVLLYAVDIKTAGSLSLAVSLPTMLVAFARYSRDGSFAVLGENRRFVVLMASGSVFGTIVGGLTVGVVANGVLIPLLTALLLVSAWKVWGHR